MGAGFGHTYTVYNKSYAALAFSHIDTNEFESDEDMMEFERSELRNMLNTFTTVDVTFKQRTFTVDLRIELTYNGDDRIIVPCDLWDEYTATIVNNSTQDDKIDWKRVSADEDDLVNAFENALCAEILKEYPFMLVRRRSLGWCGTAYEGIQQFLQTNVPIVLTNSSVKMYPKIFKNNQE